MKLNRQEKEIVRKKFCAYCIKVLHGEALNYLDELKRQREREVSFSDLLQKDLDALYLYDDYELAEKFTVLGKQVSVRDEWISEALKKLPEKKREIILMLYFLDMTEKEIAACLKLVQSTVHYHKDDSLRLLRKLME
ncbi:sigma-70 family RNA polymerase sigma factor [Enterococcus faecium]|uniref:sigma-70 family RNA polymerase sigma factor n=1 Tax=Enterococcus faecium TaxID=1352 RepID=UPI001AD722A4|nr:sigma-70 family RNA polymerase sigma factor [Enterococcus faecium]MBO6333682.1 sigma-70 family RNA polymerase sigma factor [Enterococcus faecium]